MNYIDVYQSCFSSIFKESSAVTAMQNLMLICDISVVSLALSSTAHLNKAA